MTAFVDASALVAVIADEEGADLIADRLEGSAVRLTSPIAIWETVRAICRLHRIGVQPARVEVDRYVAAAGLTLVSIGEQEQRLALDALAQYGKGNHPADLNMGDCFAYACAKSHNADLIYKGNDFAKTDLA